MENNFEENSSKLDSNKKLAEEKNAEEISTAPPAKRSRGPRKTPVSKTEKPKGRRGRPRKIELEKPKPKKALPRICIETTQEVSEKDPNEVVKKKNTSVKKRSFSNLKYQSDQLGIKIETQATIDDQVFKNTEPSKKSDVVLPHEAFAKEFASTEKKKMMSYAGPRKSAATVNNQSNNFQFDTLMKSFAQDEEAKKKNEALEPTDEDRNKTKEPMLFDDFSHSVEEIETKPKRGGQKNKPQKNGTRSRKQAGKKMDLKNQVNYFSEIRYHCITKKSWKHVKKMLFF